MSAPATPPVPHKSTTPFAIAAAILLGLSMLSSAAAHLVEGGLFGSATIGAAIVPLLVASVTYGVAYLIAKSPTRRRSATIAVVWVMAILLTVNLARTGRSVATGPFPPLTPAELVDLEVTSTEFRHPILGFSAPNPGDGFVEDTAGERQANERASARGAPNFFWSFIREEPFAVASVQLATGLDATEQVFRDFTSSMRKPIAVSGKLLADTLIWGAERKEFRITFQHSETGAFVKVRCLPSPADRAKPFIVCAMSTAFDTTALNAFREGLSVDRTEPARSVRVP